MLKKSIGIGLLFLAGHSYATIQVTTTEDVVKDDNVCSLREAITYVNEYLSDDDKKKAGYNGCGGEDATSTILLESDKVYTLDQAIEIKAALSIQTQNNDLSSDTASIGLHNATIKASGNHRLFTIDDGKADISQLAVYLTQVNLQGCGSANICADLGGIIYNREALTIAYAKISQGYANQGGAIYSDGLIAGTNTYSAGSVVMNNSILTENKAKNGAALYLGQPLFRITYSVIRNNTATDSNGSIIYSTNAFDDETTGTESFTRAAYILNSTLFKNTGYLMNLRDGVYANNVTIVDNSKGLYFDAPKGKAHLSNSILAGNNNADCGFASGDQSLFYNNLVASRALCGTGEIGNENIDLSTQPNNQLFAGSSSEGSCNLPPAKGLLCPFKTPDNAFLGFFKPRLLSIYQTILDSPIINRGRLYSDGTDQGQFACENTDQRGLTRANAVHCDLGAIELVISSENISRVGQSIFYGEIAEMSIADNLADGELLPAEECKNVFGTDKDPNGNPWTIGCLRIEQSSATPQSKGKLTLDEDGKLVYVPNANWHGLDEFNLRIVTTASRFSEAESDRDIVIPVRIIQNPPDDFKSDKIKVSGGSFGGLSIFGLLLLALRRRTKA
ncbi:rhombotarget A [Acinetobacter populi]|uniref:Rhombotarget A n=1 Tax=Acinetobacter populi TaxID=1582270 RepID=A0A1Z9Z209_9GAMM|nr:rhombotarget A [Acinetobacter populi]OUY08466.1 rhombotarget A [Acinetobacter populi]